MQTTFRINNINVLRKYLLENNPHVRQSGSPIIPPTIADYLSHASLTNHVVEEDCTDPTKLQALNKRYIEKITDLEARLQVAGDSRFCDVSRNLLAVMFLEAENLADTGLWGETRRKYTTALQRLKRYLLMLEKNPDFQFCETRFKEGYFSTYHTKNPGDYAVLAYMLLQT